VWGQCVAISEADASQPVNFCIVDFRDKRGKTAHMVCGAAGNVSQDYIALKLASTPQAAGADAERIVCVNVTRLIRFMRETGAKHGINLIGSSFLPPPDDPRTAALLAPCTEAREQAVEVVEALKAGDEQRAKRAGMLARSALEAMIPMPEGTRLQ
jgi:hypothetical protein